MSPRPILTRTARPHGDVDIRFGSPRSEPAHSAPSMARMTQSVMTVKYPACVSRWRHWCLLKSVFRKCSCTHMMSLCVSRARRSTDVASVQCPAFQVTSRTLPAVSGRGGGGSPGPSCAGSAGLSPRPSASACTGGFLWAQEFRAGVLFVVLLCSPCTQRGLFQPRASPRIGDLAGTLLAATTVAIASSTTILVHGSATPLWRGLRRRGRGRAVAWQPT